MLAHPAAALGLWAVNLVFWHLAGPHEAAVRGDAAHALQHLCFIGAGANVWMALLGPLPKPAWFGNLAKLGFIVAVRLLGHGAGQRLPVGARRVLRRLRRSPIRWPTRSPRAR